VPSVRHTRFAALAIVATALAYAVPVSDLGWNQGSHYALVESLDRGTARIDRFRGRTGDVAWFHGHFYSTKAPGLALATVPAYATLEATGATALISHRTATAEKAASVTIWALHLWTVVLPAVLLLLLVRWAAERVEPGMGTATALTLGLGTLVLPFATLFFSHVLSACLGFGAFVLIWRDRKVDARPALLFAAGLLVGLAITAEYSLAIVGVALALYGSIGRPRAGSRALAYAAGAAFGVIPLLLYNRFAFGSIWHVSYSDAVSRPGQSGHAELGANSTGFFGVGLPSPRVAAELLFASRGILTLAPVLAMSVAGLVVLYRRGWRAEMITISFVALAFLVFNAGYFLPFGGDVPGPRLLVPALPFVAVPLAAAYRRYPGSTLALAVASVAMLVTATATLPLLPDDDTSRWASLARHGEFQDTVASFGGAAHGWLVVLPFLIPVVAAFSLGVLATPRLTIERRDAWIALSLLLAWGLCASIVPRIGYAPGSGAIVLIGCAAGIGALSVAASVLAARRLTSVDAAAPVGQA
jgi:hypothetical protein